MKKKKQEKKKQIFNRLIKRINAKENIIIYFKVLFTQEINNTRQQRQKIKKNGKKI